jgi:hypothetical protein
MFWRLHRHFVTLLMLIFNETIIIEEAHYIEWLNWMKNVHIPAIMATGYFDSYRVLNVVDSPNEGVTSCVQYHSANAENFNKFYEEHFNKFQTIHQQRYENKFVLYNTLMEVIDEGVI